MRGMRRSELVAGLVPGVEKYNKSATLSVSVQ